MSLPWMKWYPNDWLSDAALRTCSVGARGLWMDLLALMHKNGRRGYLCVNGTPLSPQQIARLTGCCAEEVSRLLTELLDSGVASVTEDGTVYCRRMVNEESKRRKCSEAGTKGGGNPALRRNLETSKPPIKVDPNVGPKVPPKVASELLSMSSSDFEVTSEEEEEKQEHTPQGVGGVGDGGRNGHAPGLFGDLPAPPRKAGRPGRPLADSDDPLWRRFWEAYPKKVGKIDARKAWDKVDATPELLATMLAAIEVHKRHFPWSEGRYHDPATWLNNRRWEDEFPAEPARASREQAIDQALAKLKARKEASGGA